jgi:hypothetical protein
MMRNRPLTPGETEAMQVAAEFAAERRATRSRGEVIRSALRQAAS